MGFVFALFYPFLIIIYALLAGALIASLIVFINNMRNGVANKWPTKNLVGAIIAGIIFVVALTTTMIVIYYTTIGFSSDSHPNSSSSVEAAISLMTLKLLK
ncbi:MAG: hypothetical protein J6I84_08085 [Bacilli bacterium]|nr:hypothetical protein [Bacilli bacterium]